MKGPSRSLLSILVSIVTTAFMLASCTQSFVCGRAAPVIEYDTVNADKEAKEFSPPPDLSYVYVVRPKNMTGMCAPIQVYMNSSKIGILGNNTYYLIPVVPGTYRISGKGLLHKAGIKKPVTSLAVEFETYAQRLYFFSISFGVEPEWHVDLQRIPLDEGEALINSAKRAKVPDQLSF